MSPCDYCGGRYDMCEGWCTWSRFCMDCNCKFRVKYTYWESTLVLLEEERPDSDDDYWGVSFKYSFSRTDHKNCKVNKCCGTLIGDEHKIWCFNPVENNKIKHIFEKIEEDSEVMLVCKICNEKIVGDISQIKKDSIFYNYVTYCKHPELLDIKMKANLELINKYKVLIDKHTNIYNELNIVKKKIKKRLKKKYYIKPKIKEKLI